MTLMRILRATLAVAGMALAGSAWAANIAPNPGLELNNGTDGANDWDLFAAVPGEATGQVLTSGAYEGAYAFRATRNGTSGDVVLHNWGSPALVTFPAMVTGGFYLRDPNNVGTQVEVHLFTMDGAGNWVGDRGSRTFTLTDQWQKYEVEAWLNSNVAKLGLAFRVQGTGTMDVDAISIEPVNVAASGNILLNPGMELNSGGNAAQWWRMFIGTPGDASLQIIPDAVDGTAAVRVARTGTNGDVVFDNWDTQMPVAGGADYSAQFTMKDPNNAGTQVEVHMTVMSDAGAWLSDVGSQTFTLTGSYQTYHLNLVNLPAGARYGGIAFRIQGTGTMDLDQVYMYQGADLPVELSAFAAE